MIRAIIKNNLILLLLLLLGIQSCKKDLLEPTAAVMIKDFYPNSGRGGTLVTVSGEGFGTDSKAYTCTFGGNTAEVVSTTDTRMVLLAPLTETSGAIILKKGSDSFEVGQFTYQDLSIKRLQPQKGIVGSDIHIIGQGFAGTAGKAKVTINGAEAVIKTLNDTLIVATVPLTVSGNVEVFVDEKETKGPEFTVQTIRAIAPATGGVGTRVTLSGSGFETGMLVYFNDLPAEVLEIAADRIIVRAPHEVQTGPIVVLDGSTKIQSPVFTVVDPPVITEVTPLSGPAGTEMTLYGTGFSSLPGETKISISGVDIPITLAEANKLKLTVPAGVGRGKIVVSVNDQATTGPEFIEQALGITSFAPESLSAGKTVKLIGSGFSTVPSQNTVLFNGLPGEVKTATYNELTVIAPAHIQKGYITVQVNGLTARSSKAYSTSGIITLAGGPGTGLLDLSAGGKIVVDASQNVFVMEIAKHRVMKISPSGSVSLFAGSPSGTPGSSNGTGAAASFRFYANSDMVIDRSGNIYVIEDDATIRKITPSGNTSYFFNEISGAGYQLAGMLPRADGGLYCGVPGTTMFLGISSSGSMDQYLDIPGLDRLTHQRLAMTGGYVYFNFLSAISRDDLSGKNEVAWVGLNRSGFVDGIGRTARFGSIIPAIVADSRGNLLVSDPANYAIRKVMVANQEVSTVVRGASGFADGSLTDAKFGNSPYNDLAISSSGVLYLLDVVNNAVRRIELE